MKKLNIIDKSQRAYNFEENSVGTFGPCITDKDCVFVNSCCGIAYKELGDGFHIMCAPKNPIIQPNWNPTWVGYNFRCLSAMDGADILIASSIIVSSAMASIL